MSSLIQQGQEDVYLNFVNSIKSDITKKIYDKTRLGVRRAMKPKASFLPNRLKRRTL